MNYVLTTEMMPLASINISGGTQSRVSIDATVACEYGDAMAEGVTFPPVIVFFDGKEHWLGDGFHRLHGARTAGLQEILVEVRHGTRLDAIAYSAGANEEHGLRRTTADKESAIRMLLGNEEFSKRPLKWVQETAKVSHHLVSKVLADIEAETGKKRPQAVDSRGRKVNRGDATDVKTLNRGDAAARPRLSNTDDKPLPTLDDCKREVPDSLSEQHATGRAIHGLVCDAGQYLNKVKALQGQSGAERVDFHRIERVMKEVQQLLKSAKYHTKCPTCLDGAATGCESCSGDGWITTGQFRRLSEAERTKLVGVCPI